MANPKLIPVPFANTGTKTTIPVTRASNDAAEMPDYDGGFPPITSTPLAAGGKAPRRPDFNGILNDITANIRHLNSGGFFTFDAAFATKIGGYPKGAVLLSNDGSKKYVSLIDGNTSDFNVSVDVTKWAKAAMTERETQDIAWGEGQTSAPWAPKDSPALTGMPTAPTAATGTNTTQVATTAFVNAEIAADRPFESTAGNIKMDGAQSVGSLNTVARGDHTHPTDTSRAPLASPALTGIPTMPTATASTNTTQGASTAFVHAAITLDRPYEASASNIKMDGAQSVGSLNTVARGDHTHPTDTTRAAVASFLSSKVANGYQTLEGGLIIQWGVSSYVGTSGATGTVCNLPIVFPNAGLQIVASDTYGGVNPCAAAFENKSQIRVWGKNVGGSYADTTMRFIAIGY